MKNTITITQVQVHVSMMGNRPILEKLIDAVSMYEGEREQVWEVRKVKVAESFNKFGSRPVQVVFGFWRGRGLIIVMDYDRGWMIYEIWIDMLIDQILSGA